MNLKKWFWGLFFICAAVLVIVRQLGYLTGVSLFGLAMTVLLLPVVFKSLAHRNLWGVFFPAAVFLIVFASPLGLESLTPWPVLFAALFLSIASSILIKPRQYKGTFIHCNISGNNSTDCLFDNDTDCRVSFGASSKFLHCTNLQKAFFSCAFGELKVFFDNAQLHPDGATVTLDCSLGAIELYIPKNWRIESNISTILAGVNETDRRMEGDGPVLTITGCLRLGSVEIISV